MSVSGWLRPHLALASDPLQSDALKITWTSSPSPFVATTGRPIVYGFIPDGRYILVIHKKIDEQTLHPITAYEIEVSGA
jgi:hypothetical protein